MNDFNYIAWSQPRDPSHRDAIAIDGELTVPGDDADAKRALALKAIAATVRNAEPRRGNGFEYWRTRDAVVVELRAPWADGEEGSGAVTLWASRKSLPGVAPIRDAIESVAAAAGLLHDSREFHSLPSQIRRIAGHARCLRWFR